VDSFVSLLLLLHVSFGVLALATSFAAMATKKGSKFHRRVGALYFWAMLGIAITAIPVTFYRPNPFLFAIALFSFYFAFAGYRRGKSKFEFEPIDKVAAYLMVLVSLGMIGYGLYMAIYIAPNGWSLFAFGLIGLQNSLEDVKDSKSGIDFHNKVARHLQRMIAGTIATVTAVLVQQVSTRLDQQTAWPILVWLSPTALLVPLIFIWSRRVLVDRRMTLINRVSK
jgi:uncharacterized membrane protein